MTNEELYLKQLERIIDEQMRDLIKKRAKAANSGDYAEIAKCSFRLDDLDNIKNILKGT